MPNRSSSQLIMPNSLVEERLNTIATAAVEVKFGASTRSGTGSAPAAAGSARSPAAARQQLRDGGDHEDADGVHLARQKSASASSSA